MRWIRRKLLYHKGLTCHLRALDFNFVGNRVMASSKYGNLIVRIVFQKYFVVSEENNKKYFWLEV